jgi:hypothetical protein
LEELLHPGRRVWVVAKAEERDGWIIPASVYSCDIRSFKQFLPRGIFNSERGTVERKQSLVQLYTDPGGYRTIAVANIRMKDPTKAR